MQVRSTISYSKLAKMRAKSVAQCIQDFFLYEPGSSKPWVVPETGYLEIDFCYEPRPPTELAIANQTGLAGLTCSILEAGADSRLEVLTLVCQDWYFLTFQCQELMDCINSGGSSLDKQEMVQLCALLIPRIVDVDFVKSFIRTNLNVSQTKSLQRILGASTFGAHVGSFCGHYTLDMSKNHDRQCALRLAELDNAEQSHLKRVWSDPDRLKYDASDKRYEAQLERLLKTFSDGGTSQVCR